MSRRRPELKKDAAELKRRFNRDFWMPEEEFFAQALDGSKRQVRAITSNPGHCLWMRVVDRPKSVHVARKLLSPELFSGWGIRTLSDRAVNYDPCSYHNGSVWPFDSTLAVAGLRQYGFAEEAERVARAMVEASIEFPLRRPPELFARHALHASGSGEDQVRNLPLNGRNFSQLIALEPGAVVSNGAVYFNGLSRDNVNISVDGTDVKVGRLPEGIRVS